VNVYRDHKFTKTQPEASALAVQRGMDNECIDYAKVADDHDYRPYIDAVKQGFLKESEMDTALVRLFIARIKLGMFDPPEMVPYTKIDEKELDSDKHRALALEMANKALVLLKNDGTLPLKKTVKKIALIGPLGDQKQYMYGNYNGTPTRSTSVLEGLKAEFPQAKITFVAGTHFLRKDGELIPSRVLSTADGKPGLEAVFSNTANAFQPNPEALAKEVHQKVDLTKEKLPKEMSGKTPIRVDWKGFITVDETGEYSLGVRYDSGFGGVTVDGKRVAGGWAGGDMVTRMSHLHLEKGKKTPIEVHYATSDKDHNSVQLIWSKYDPKPDPAAVEAAKNADVVVAVMGITSELEGEEMPVNEEGFMGGDRTSINLPKPEEDLLKAVTAAGKPVVLVLANGSALAVNWAKEHVNAIVEAWYPGEEGGTSVAQTLSGKNNPSGRLPVTFYTGVDQLPPFEDYAMKGRTYRYFEGKPLYAFGHGLSYTTFGYSAINVAKPVINAGDALKVEATVTNKGKVAGDEVAQLYLTFPQVPGAPLRALRGFKRVHLNPGESKKVSFELQDRDLSMVSEAGSIQVSEGKYGVVVGGGQPGTEAPVITANFEVKGTKVLPE